MPVRIANKELQNAIGPDAAGWEGNPQAGEVIFPLLERIDAKGEVVAAMV